MTVLLALCAARPTPWWIWLILGSTYLLALWAILGAVLLMVRDLRNPRAGRDG